MASRKSESYRDPYKYPRPETDENFMGKAKAKNYLGKTSPKHCHEIQPWNRLSKNHTIASYQHRVNTNSIPVVQKEEAFYDASIVIPAPSVNVDPYLFNNNKICDYPRLCRGTQDIMERSLFFNSSF